MQQIPELLTPLTTLLSVTLLRNHPQELNKAKFISPPEGTQIQAVKVLVKRFDSDSQPQDQTTSGTKSGDINLVNDNTYLFLRHS